MESKAVFFFYGSYLIGKLSSVLLKHLSERKGTSISTWNEHILQLWDSECPFNGKSDMFIMNSR